MRRSYALAAIFALALPAVAAAQDHHDEHKGPPPGHPGGPPHPPPHPGPGPGGPHPQFKQVGPQHGPTAGPNPQFKQVAPQHGPMSGPNPAFVHPGPGPGGPAPAFAHGPHFPPPGSPHFTFHGHDFNRVHVHPFIYPHGWAYREWAVGAILPPLFLVPDYYYPEWAALGLEPPPPGDQWVRYGPDLLLVDMTTGQVIDVAYGVFYED
jgi:Nickel/cobalt transporter regulator